MVRASINPETYYDLQAVCELLDVTKYAVNSACRDGLLRFSQLAGKKRLFRGSWLIEWIESSGTKLEAAAS